MRFMANYDFHHPRPRVVARFRDPARIEAVLSDLGATLQRDTDSVQPGWNGAIQLRGVQREFRASLREPDPGNAMILDVRADIAEANLLFLFTDLPSGGCRVTSEATLTPHTTLARLALASLTMVTRRLSKRLARLTQALGRA